MFAVIKTGGKQYIVRKGSKVSIERLEGEKGDTVKFSDVLLTAQESKTTVGVPRVAGAHVEGKILEQSRGDKKIVFRYHSKTRYRKKKGHRQHYTEVEITKI